MRLPSLCLAVLVLAACGADPLDVAEGTHVQALATSTYFRLLPAEDGTYVASRANGGRLRCGDGGRAASCPVAQLELPSDCDWECTDGLLSFRGVVVVRGRLVGSSEGPATLVVDAGFDTYDATLGALPLYRLEARNDGAFVSKRLSSSSSTTMRAVDFTEAHDPNYVLDPARGIAQMASPEGLLVTGARKRGTFVVDRVFRQWTPKPAI